MPLIRTVNGVVVEKVFRSFGEGDGGYFVTIVTEDDRIQNFWADKSLERLLGEVHSIEGYDHELARTFRLSVKEWNGKIKMSLQPGTIM